MCYLEATSGLFEWTGDHQRRTVVLQVSLELLADHFGRVALVRAGDRVAAALAVVRRQRLEGELFGAVATGDEPLGALDGLVLHQLFAAHFLSALVVAVDRLHRARSQVTLLIETSSARPQEGQKKKGKKH